MGPLQYSYRIIDNSKKEVLASGSGHVENLENIFPREIYGFLKKEAENGRLVDTRIKMTDLTYEIKKAD